MYDNLTTRPAPIAVGILLFLAIGSFIGAGIVGMASGSSSEPETQPADPPPATVTWEKLEAPGDGGWPVYRIPTPEGWIVVVAGSGPVVVDDWLHAWEPGKTAADYRARREQNALEALAALEEERKQAAEKQAE